MARKNRPAHGGIQFHKCGDAYLIELLDSNGRAFAHYAADAAAAAWLAGAILDQVTSDARAAGIPTTMGTA